MVVRTYNLEINCIIARGQPEPTIEWLHNGTKISSDAYQIMNGSLLIQSVHPDRDSGTLTCRADTPSVGYDEVNSTVTVIGMSTLHV